MSTETPSSTGTAPPPPPPRNDDDSETIFVISLASGAVGVVLLMVAAMIYYTVSSAEPGASFPAWFDKRQWVLAVGTGLTVLGVGLQANRLWELLYRRRSLFALNAILMSVLAIALTVLIDYVTTRHFHEFDWTRQGVFTISDESQQVAKNLDRNVRIWIVLPDGNEADLVRRLVDHYRAQTSKIEVLTLDPLLDRDKLMGILADLNIENPRTLSDVVGVYVQRGYYETNAKNQVIWHTEKSKRLGATDFFESGFDPMSGQQGQKKFKGEQALTNALMEVSEDKKSKIYFLGGHGEFDTSGMGPRDTFQAGAFAKELRGKNYDVTDLSIMARKTKDVPEDCDALVIGGPKQTIDPVEVTAIDKYLAGGGKALVFAPPVYTKNEDNTYDWKETGIEPLLRKYNVDAVKNVVLGIIPLSGGQVGITPEVFPDQMDAGSKITAPLVGAQLAFKKARPLKALADNPHAKTSELVKTRENEYLAVPDLSKIEEVSESKPIPLAVSVEQKLDPKPGEKEKVTRLVVIGDASFVSNAYLRQGANEPFVLNAISWLFGQQRFTKEAVREGDYHIDMGEVGFLYRLIACPGVPLLSILIGLAVWIVRRR